MYVSILILKINIKKAAADKTSAALLWRRHASYNRSVVNVLWEATTKDQATLTCKRFTALTSFNLLLSYPGQKVLSQTEYSLLAILSGVTPYRTKATQKENTLQAQRRGGRHSVSNSFIPCKWPKMTLAEELRSRNFSENIWRLGLPPSPPRPPWGSQHADHILLPHSRYLWTMVSGVKYFFVKESGVIILQWKTMHHLRESSSAHAQKKPPPDRKSKGH